MSSYTAGMASTPFRTAPPDEPGISRKVLLVAAAVVVAAVLGVALATLRRPPAKVGGTLPPDPYASQLAITELTLSEATNGTGGKVTYVDGRVRNSGTKTLTSATVDVGFQAEDGSIPHAEVVPLTLIRTRQPYVDLEPLSAEPLPPGGSHEFRLIFETVPESWDQKPPRLRVIHAGVR